MPINSRAKGHDFEREVVKLLNKEFSWIITDTKNDGFRRVPQSGAFDKTKFPGDIVTLHTELAPLIEITFECKFYKDWKLEDLINGNICILLQWFKQASDDAAEAGKMPVVIFKKNRSKIYVLAWKTFMENYVTNRLDVQEAGNFPYLSIVTFDEFIPIYSLYIRRKYDKERDIESSTKGKDGGDGW